MDLDNIYQTLLSQQRDFKNENGYSDQCVEHLTENGDEPELPMDPCNFLHDMDSKIDKDEDIIDLDEFKDILGEFNDDTMLIDEDLSSNDDNNGNNNVHSSIESKALLDLDYSNTVFVDSDFQKEAVVKNIKNNDLLSNEIVFIDNDGKIEIEIEASSKNHAINAKTQQSNMNNSIETTLPSFQEAFRIFCNVPFNTFTQKKVRKHNVKYENEDNSHKDDGNELQITSIDVTDDSGDDITLVEDQTEYYDSILAQNFKILDNLTTSDAIDSIARKQEETNPTEYDTDCDGYNSSDFEFITESEAETCGIVVNARSKLNQRTRLNKAKAIKDSQNIKYKELAQDNVLDDNLLRKRSETNKSDENALDPHKIPEGEDFFNLFLGDNVPILPMHYMMENKSVGGRSCMAVENHGIGFNMNTMGRDDNSVDDELKQGAEMTVKKILRMYPFENCKRKRRH